MYQVTCTKGLIGKKSWNQPGSSRHGILYKHEHELQTSACLCPDPFTTLSLLHSVLYLNTTFPRLLCQLVVIEFQPMGGAGKRLEGGRKGEARVFLRLSYLKGACPPVVHFLHGPNSHLAVCVGSWQVAWLLAPVTLPPRFSLQLGDSSGSAVARFWLPHCTASFPSPLHGSVSGAAY